MCHDIYTGSKDWDVDILGSHYSPYHLQQGSWYCWNMRLMIDLFNEDMWAGMKEFDGEIKHPENSHYHEKQKCQSN